MSRALVVAVAIGVVGCAALPLPDRSDRSQVIQRILSSSVQLRGELEGGGLRAASGVVIASDSRARRCWIITARHFMEPTKPRRILASVTGYWDRLSGEVVAVSDDYDLAVISVQGVSPPAVTLKDTTLLGEDVWVVAFPWGRRLTLASGIVSQLAGDEGEARQEGPARMVNASVSYGASGGGIFEASTGLLIGIVESYRTARVTPPKAPESALDIPVPGETTVVSAFAIRRFLSSTGLDGQMSK